MIESEKEPAVAAKPPGMSAGKVGRFFSLLGLGGILALMVFKPG